MKSRIIDETVGGQKEIRNKRSDSVQFGDEDAAKGNEESQNVTV